MIWSLLSSPYGGVRWLESDCFRRVAFIERFNGRLRDECLNETLFTSLRHARQVLEAWRRNYNTIRPHSALKGMTPTDFAKHTTRRLQSEGATLPIAMTANNGHQSTSGLQL